MLTSQSALS
jgi:hypothetical protein